MSSFQLGWRMLFLEWYVKTMSFVINVCACRDADLSRLGRQMDVL